MVMSDFIVSLLQSSTWVLIFISSFFFGLFFLLFVIFTSLGHHGLDNTLHGQDTSVTDAHDLSHLDSGVAHDLGHDQLADLGHDLVSQVHLDDINYLDGHIEMDQAGDISIVKDAIYVEKSNYAMGNISVFLLIFGQIGWIFASELSDIILGIAILAGVIVSRLFSWGLSNYAKTVIVPVQKVSRGDIGTVISEVTHTKLGIVNVNKKDGMVITVLAKGAYPHDSFIQGERGYIWEEENNLYTITRGLTDQPDLNTTSFKPKTKKALG